MSGGTRTTKARAEAVAALQALHLFKAAEAITAPIRLRVGRRNLCMFYAPFVRPGDLVFDIGANTGEHTEVLLRLGCRVVSVEPQAAVSARLAARHSGRAEIVVAAVADSPGERILFLNTLSDELATLVPEESREGRFRRGWEGSERVQVTTLDRLIEERGIPALCKIDVEGSEPQVLRGLSHPISTVIFEFSEGLRGTHECLGLLSALGSYRFGYRIGRSPRPTPATMSAVQVWERLPRNSHGDIIASLALRSP
jgi:FkbM family methyltransferase